MKVLIIPEDPTLDRHILKPIVEKMFTEIGRRADVMMLENPRLSGVAEALAADTVKTIVGMYPMIDLFLLMVDNDGSQSGNATKAAQREAEYQDKLIACLAIEEVEVWMLALHRDEVRDTLGARWQEIREHRDPKEAYAAPFIQAMKWSDGVGRGRKDAMKALPTQWNGLLQVCSELAGLKRRVEVWLQTH